MRPPIKPGAPPNIQQPLRDIMRGVGLFAEMTEETLKPAAGLLPGPVRDTFRGVLTSLEAVGARAATPKVDARIVLQASGFVLGDRTGGAEDLVQALAFAWGKTSALRIEKHFLFSEVVAARALANLQMAPDLTSRVRCAMIFKTLANAHTMGRMPGVEPSLPAQDQTEVELFLFAALVWLSTERATSLREEEQLLDLALALTMAKSQTVSQTFGDLEQVAWALHDLADHL